MRACPKLETSFWLRSIQQPENCYDKKSSPFCIVTRGIRLTKILENVNTSQKRTINCFLTELSITNTCMLHWRVGFALPKLGRLGLHGLLFAIIVVRFRCKVDVAYGALLTFTLKAFALASTSGNRLSIALLPLLSCTFLHC